MPAIKPRSSCCSFLKSPGQARPRSQPDHLPQVLSSSLDHLDLLHLHFLLRRVQLRRLPKLTVLNLSNNLIASVNPNTFPKNSQLRTLNLASNSIEVSSSKRCPDEKQLIIEKKTRSYLFFIQILEAGCLDQLSKLEELKLSRNRLSSLPKMVTKISLSS